MSPALYVTCSMVLNCGIPMALAVRELWSLGPTPRRGRPDGDIDRPVTPDLPIAGLKPLPDCLIPRLDPLPPPAPVRERELETA
jgi:hypothetical protein